MSVEVKNITKSYGAQKALSHVSLSIGERCVVGLLGPNGAGKSTLMKVLTGYLRADEGMASICGLDIESHSTEIRRLIGYLPEHNPLYTDMYVREYLTMAAGQYDVADKTARVEELVARTGLTPEAHKMIGELSKGYRQRVGIAQALIGNPRVVILDEPTTGLDPNQIVDIRCLIRSLAEERTVILSTHIMQEVEAVCDSLVIIDKGIIRAQGTVGEVLGMADGGQVVEVEFDADADSEAMAKELGAHVAGEGGKRSFRVSTSSTSDDLRLSLFRYAVRHDLPLLRLNMVGGDVEDVFHRLTGKA